MARVVAEWLVDALAKAHGNPALKRLERLVHGVEAFTTNMNASGVFDDPYKAGLLKVLEDLGRELGETCEREGHREALADLDLPAPAGDADVASDMADNTAGDPESSNA